MFTMDAKRLSRTHGVFSRAHSAFSRLRRAHSASRAYGVPYESEPRGVCLPLHRESPTEARDKLPKDRKRRSASDLKKKSTEYRKESSLGKTPGLGSRLLIGKNPSLFVFYFRLANGYRGRIASSAPTAFPTKANGKEFAFCSIWEGP